MWQTANVRIPASDVKAFRERGRELGLGPLVPCELSDHLAASQPMLRTRSIQAFTGVSARAGAGRGLCGGASGVACGESSAEQAIATIIESVKQAARRRATGQDAYFD